MIEARQTPIEEMTVEEARAVAGAPMTSEQRATFERDGYLVVPGVLSPEEVERYGAVVERRYQAARAENGLFYNGGIHQLCAVASCPELAPLADHPGILGLVWSVLEWNIHIAHSHIDVNPKVENPGPFHYEWHQDGGRQNREICTNPRPRFSVKAAYWLSDVSEPGRGNMKLVPGSHAANRIDGPPSRDVEWPDPPGTIEAVANAGDVILFDRRIWHARSDNRSDVVRRVVFFAYSYRWTVTRDVPPVDDGSFTPVQRQLLGLLPDVDGDHAWGHFPSKVPLHELLKRADLLSTLGPPLPPPEPVVWPV